MNAYVKKGGFTIVELLVVIVVISILAGIAYFNGQGFIQRGADSAAKGDISKIGSALQSYYNKNGEFPIPSPNPLSNATTPTAIDFLTNNLNNAQLSQSQEEIDYYGISTNAANAGNYCLHIKNNQYSTINYYISTKNTIPVSGTCPSSGDVAAASAW
jgi:prepilin-type N-terminal cleavage/methylation domain-containing protein